ncbi:hypothetical protein MTO96_044873, partial [Rhipicephalus appendiculatus]
RPEDTLNDLLQSMSERQGLDSPSKLTTDLHVWPDFHGNRSPLADPTLRGMICGLTLTADEGGPCAAVSRYASSTSLRVWPRTPLYVRSLADATGLPVLLPSETESVLLGGAILAASACGRYASVKEAMLRMGGSGHVMTPQMSERSFHDAKYAAFHALLDCQRRLREIMSSGQPASSCS